MVIAYQFCANLQSFSIIPNKAGEKRKNNRVVFLFFLHGNNLSGATYAKLLIVLKVVEGFAAENPETAEKYRRELHSRYADLHNKLTRQARKEKLKKEALEHASAAFRYRPGLKSFFRLLGAKLGL